MSRFSKKFYKDKFRGKLFGVCAGIGDYFDWNPLWVRLALVIAIFAGGLPLVIPAYLLAALIADAKPPHMYDESLFRTFGDAPPLKNTAKTDRIRKEQKTPSKMEMIDE